MCCSSHYSTRSLCRMMHVFHSLCSPLISGRDMCVLVWKPSLCSVFKLLDEYLHIQRFWMFLRWRQSFLQKFVWWLVGQIMIHIWDVLGNFVKSKIIRKKLLMCVHCKVRHPEYVGIGAETHEQKWPYPGILLINLGWILVTTVRCVYTYVQRLIAFP